MTRQPPAGKCSPAQWVSVDAFRPRLLTSFQDRKLVWD